jgi:predicted Zn-dependent peptidase
VPQDVFQHTFPNGLTLLAERMDHVRSAAVNILVPAGAIYDPPGREGIGSLLSELIIRGAGERDNRALTLALDNLGLDRSESVGTFHLRFSGATLAKNLPAVLDLYADIVRRPHLPEGEVDAVRSLALQDLAGLEDEPRQKVLLELRKRHYPKPLCNDRHGTEAGITASTWSDIRQQFEQRFHAKGTIMSVAGNIEWPSLRDQVGRLFGDWPAGEDREPKCGPSMAVIEHIPKETTQTQIGIAYPSVPFADKDYYDALAAVQVLSGGMSSRLFTEVREKEGLCYAVWATYQTFKDRASVIAYAGTTTARAQETLEVTLRELKRLREGIEDDEVDRVRAGLKSSLIMQEESTGSRAASIASDWYHLGRVRSFDEIRDAIDGLTPKKIVSHLERCPPKDFAVLTLGEKSLLVPAN